MKKALAMFALIASTCNLACQAETFQFDLYKELAKNKANSNLLVSPYSVQTALSMATLGAGGTTYDAMTQTLGLTALKDAPESIGKNCMNTRKLLEETGRETSLSIANNLFGDKTIHFDKKYTGEMKTYFDADLTTLDFASPDAVANINNWVKTKTKNLIPTLLDKVDSNAKLFLVNAVYFKCGWADQFDPKLTTSKSFHTLDEQMVKVPMMEADRKKINYCQTNDFKAISLPYKNGRFKMFLFLPNESSSLEELEGKLNENSWQNWMSQFDENPGKITLPKFKIQDSMTMKGSLSTLGMNEAFDSQKADFSKMVGKDSKTELFLSEVLHKTFLQLNEEGTEATAATAVEASSKALNLAGQYFQLKFDHPFLFALYDLKTRKILFLGHVADPSK